MTGAGDVMKTVLGVLGGLLISHIIRPAFEEWLHGGWIIKGQGGNWANPWELPLPVADVKLLRGKDAATWKARLGAYCSGGGFATFSYDAAAPGGVLDPELVVNMENKTVTITLPPPKPRETVTKG